jgi:NNP family nitrate/nitrite transporter-like MFS transporter
MGGAKVLVGVFLAIAVLSPFLSFDTIVPFTIGALGCAAVLGLGNGAVFKLVPEYFPKETGTVTGLVGAFGGLGGFFPPLELGLIKDNFGTYTLGFLLLSLFSIMCLVVNYLSFLRGPVEKLPVGQPARMI